ncbi:glycosyltransferase [Caproiciproducens sp.]|uniref:glycosyltransferase n=1 Tax=Caproiciproducens sp. TaxID=1954376 RepID=UPI0028994E1B|nr:glycosyltransferase [Caproiciproducens sp.]
MKIAVFTDSYINQPSAVSANIAVLKSGLQKLGHEMLTVSCELEADDCYMQGQTVFCPAKISAGLYGQSPKDNRLRTVARLTDQFAPEVVHIVTFGAMGMYGLQYARKRGLPVLTTLYNLHDATDGYGPNSFIEKIHLRRSQKRLFRLLSQSDAVTSASRKNSMIVRDLKLKCRVRNVPFCVDLDLFKPLYSIDSGVEALRQKLHVAKEKSIVVFSGSLTDDCGADRLFENWSKCVSINDNLHLLVAGTGKESAALIEKAKLLGISDQVTFAGELQREELCTCFAMCRAFVSACETAAIKSSPVEAIACGIPVLLKKGSANADLITEGVNGFTYGEPAEFGQLVKKLAKMDSEGEVLMKKLVSKTAAALTDINQAKAFVSCYELAVEKHKNRT